MRSHYPQAILPTMTKRPILFILLSTFIACSGGDSGGCAGCSDLEVISYPNPAPEGGEVQADVIRAHLPQTLLDFLESHLDSLLNPALSIENGQAKFYLDSSVIPADSPIQFREGSYFSFNTDNLNNAIDLQFIPSAADQAASNDPLPAGIRLVVAELELFTDMVITTELDTELIPHAACHIRSRLPCCALALQRSRPRTEKLYRNKKQHRRFRKLSADSKKSAYCV